MMLLRLLDPCGSEFEEEDTYKTKSVSKQG